jgi:hypothetical protein
MPVHYVVFHDVLSPVMRDLAICGDSPDLIQGLKPGMPILVEE